MTEWQGVFARCSSNSCTTCSAAVILSSACVITATWQQHHELGEKLTSAIKQGSAAMLVPACHCQVMALERNQTIYGNNLIQCDGKGLVWMAQLLQLSWQSNFRDAAMHRRVAGAEGNPDHYLDVFK